MSGERLCGIIFSNEIFAEGVLKMEKAYKTMKTSGAINISNDWAPELKPEYKKEYYKELFNFVGHEYATREIFPPADDIFNAFHLTPLSKVKCVISVRIPTIM